MPTVVEILYALRGLGRLVQFDARGLEFFDRSIQGFWRSFRVALLIAPFYALLIPHNIETIKPTVGWQDIIIVEILIYIVAWLLYPTVAYELCRWMSRESEYPGYIAVYNWSAILMVTAEVLVWVPTFLGMTTPDTSHVVARLAYHVFLIYLWFMAKAALRIDPFTAIGLVFVDYVLTFILSSFHVTILAP